MRLAFLVMVIAAPAAAQTTAATVSEQGAYRLSLWGTVVPVAAGAVIGVAHVDRTVPGLLISTGILFGPSLGYGEAGLGGRGLRGVAVRVGLGVASSMAAFAVCAMDCGPGQTKYDTASLILIAGAGVMAAAAAYDVARLRHNIRRKSEQRGATRLSVAPIYTPRQHAMGLRVGVRF